MNSITFDGRTDSLAGWARSLGVRVNALHSRLSDGWSLERTLTTPVGAPNNRRGNNKPADAPEPFRLVVLSPGFMVSTEAEAPHREHLCDNYEACLSAAARHEWQAECPGNCPARADRDPWEAVAMATVGRGRSSMAMCVADGEEEAA